MKSHCNVFLRLSDEKLAAHNRAKHEKKRGSIKIEGSPHYLRQTNGRFCRRAKEHTI